MKPLLIIILSLLVFSTFLFSQKTTEIKQDFYLNSGYSRTHPPLIYLDDSLCNIKLTQIDLKLYTPLFVEGDDSYVQRTYGSAQKDSSFVRKYFGDKRDRGIIFVFSKGRIENINMKKFHKYNHCKNMHKLYKIDDKPLTDEYNILKKQNMTRIQIVKNFKLKKFDTGQEDVFVLFVIKTKG